MLHASWTLLPWLPAVGLAIIGLEWFGSPAAGVIVFLTPRYRWLLRGGRKPHIFIWQLIAGATILFVCYFSLTWQAWIIALASCLGVLVVNCLLILRKQ
nr:hypothetical protein [Anaerolineae bacterium]